MKFLRRLRRAVQSFSDPVPYVSQPAPLTTELTRPGAIDNTEGWSVNQTLPNPDPILREIGLAETAYEQVLAEPQVSGAFRSRKAGVKRLSWDIDRDRAKSREAMIKSLRSYGGGREG